MILVGNNIWRGPRTDLAPLAAVGIKRLISLEWGVYEIFHNDKIEFEFPCEYGMTEYNFKCSDIMPPDPQVVAKILELVRDGIPTYIHCLKGWDRTGFICVWIRVVIFGWTKEAAIKEWKAIGRHAYYFWWERYL